MRKLMVMIIILVTSVIANAQKLAVLEGNIKELKNEKFFNIEYDYSDMRVGKFENEADYIEKKVDEYNKSEPGRGEKWHTAWVSDRAGSYHIKFEELLNKYLGNNGIYVGAEKNDAKYTMIVHTTFTEPGFNIYISKKPAMINLVITIVETENRNNVVCKIVSKNNAGKSFGSGDFDTGIRIAEAYAKAGKEFGKFCLKYWK